MGESGIANGVIHLHFEVRTITPEWGEDVENPYALMEGGALANNFGMDSYDIPWVEPLSGATVRLALLVMRGDGSYALPTAAETVTAVYYDRIKVFPSYYTIESRSGTLYVVPTETLDPETEVRADYVT
jgi:hypothetical protein